MAAPLPALPNPLVITQAGVQPQSPDALLAREIAYVASFNPGYTATLPGSLIRDMATTAVAGVVLCDQAWVDLANSISPYLANPYLLNQLGQVYGVTPNLPTNTSVYVQFSGPAGFIIAEGFTVSDGTYQYQVQAPGGIIESSAASALLYCLATVAGTWAVPDNTVTQLQTNVPSTIALSVTNPQ